MRINAFLRVVRITAALLAAAALTVTLSGLIPHLSRQIKRAADSQAAKKIMSSCNGYKVSRTANSVVYYTGADREYVRLIEGIINTWMPLLREDFALTESPYVTLIIYPDKEKMYSVIRYKTGSHKNAPTASYTAGILTMLSPSQWGQNSEEADIDLFMSKAPVIHELSHLFLDKKTNGNYKEWFSEGIALYYENKYLAAKPPERRTEPPVSFAELSNGFGFINENERYGKSYEIVRMIVRRGGERELKKIYGRLEDGKPLNSAIKHALGDKISALDKL